MRILIISFCFPPYNTIGAVRLGKTARFLREFGVDLKVLTARRQPFPEALQREVPASVVTYTPWMDIKGLIPYNRKGVAGRNGHAGRGSWKERLRKRKAWNWVKEVLFFPDEYVGWYPFAVREGVRMIHGWKPHAILASAVPFTSLLVARTLAERFHLPWIAELRDLWTDSAYYLHGERRRRIEGRLERRILHSARALVTVSTPLADQLRAKYAKPVQVVMNGIDRAGCPDAAVPKKPSDGTLRIVYTGTVYDGRRDAAPLFKAMARLGDSKSEVRVDFFGYNLTGVAEMAAELGLARHVRVHPPVPHSEALERQCRADILLLLLWDDPGEKGVYTGKLFEYLGARRPILAIGGGESAAATLIRERGAGVILNDPAAIGEQLKRWMLEKRSPAGISPLSPESGKGLSRREQVEVLLQFMNEWIHPGVGHE